MFKKYVEGKSAAFFDLDGTIIDSIPYWEEAHRKVFAEITDGDYARFSDIKWGSYIAETWKNTLEIRDVKTDYKIKDLVVKTQKAYLELFQAKPLEPRDGFWDLIYELKEEKKFKLALISNSDRAVVDRVTETLNIREKIFDLSVCGDEVRQRKPSPDIYKKALKELGLKSEEVLVFEDSVTGATSADKAGLEMIIIWDGQIRETEYPGEIYTFLPDFSGLPGNLDQYFYEAMKQRVKELEEENAAS
jgi:HAD superfamily hydrolase (TIGR01509 family)